MQQQAAKMQAYQCMNVIHHAGTPAEGAATFCVSTHRLMPSDMFLQDYTGKLGSLQGKSDDYEIAAAQIGVEVYSAMNSAVGG